ncbi:MAG: BTAD domain-containing putative transcriptional regulator [Gemmatimonadota bacterium]
MIRLILLGGARLERDGAPLDGPASQRQRLTVLAFLAASGGTATREEVLTVLWPEGDPQKNRHALSNALYGIRSALGDDVLSASGEALTLNADLIESDVAHFERAIANGELEAAHELYGGRFLSGVGAASVDFERWVEGVQDRLHAAHQEVLEALAERALHAGDARAAAQWWRRFANADPWSTRGALGLMRSLEASGDPSGALMHARTHTTLMREELEADPDASVVALEEAIRDRMAQPKEETAPEPPGPEPGPRAGVDDAEDAPAARSTTRATVGVVGVAAVLAGLFWIVASATTGPPAVQTFRSLAVLPLDNLSPGAGDEYFADGMTEVLTAELSRLDSLSVVSRTSASRYVGSGLSMPEIANELSVEALIEGSVFRAGDQVRVTVQLIDGETDVHVWAESYEATAEEPIALQRRVAREIASAISLRLTNAETNRLATGPDVGQEAQEAFLRGLTLGRRFTRTDMRDAIAEYHRALELAPDFPDAAAMLGVSYWLLTQPLVGLTPTEGMPNARRWAERGLELDPQSADALSTLGWVSLFYDRDTEAASRFFERAIEVQPEWAVGHNGLSFARLVRGDEEGAISSARTAAGSTPYDLSFRTSLAEVLYYLGRYDDTAAEVDAIIAEDPSFVRAYEVRRWVHEMRGEWREASEALQTTLALLGETSPMEDVGPVTRTEYWAWRVARLEGLNEVSGSLTGVLAGAYAQLGDAERALELLAEAIDERSGQIALLDVDPAWDPIRNEAGFQALRRRAGLDS